MTLKQMLLSEDIQDFYLAVKILEGLRNQRVVQRYVDIFFRNNKPAQHITYMTTLIEDKQQQKQISRIMMDTEKFCWSYHMTYD